MNIITGNGRKIDVFLCSDIGILSKNKTYQLEFYHKYIIMNTKRIERQDLMKKIHYTTSVNIKDKVMKLNFRGQLTNESVGNKVRVQAIFTQRTVDRRFPMDVTIEGTDIGPLVLADANIELPYVFLTPPRRQVTVTFALWLGMEEMILDDHPFPVHKEMFSRPDMTSRKSFPVFLGMTLALPVILLGYYFGGDSNLQQAKKKANALVYRNSGIPYSPRQRNTDYFASCYAKEVKRNGEVGKNRVLFLSEREPDEKDNLLRVKKLFEQDQDVEVREFIKTRTVDNLSRRELAECARECALAKMIILEDFYPQLHSLTIRPETTIVQLWHACGAFKTFGYSHMDKPGGAPQSSMNHRNYDLVCVSSERVRSLYAEAFAVPCHKIKALGVPRTDDLFDPQYKETARREICKRYPLLSKGRVVLFAPTFRGEGNKDAYYPGDAFDVGRFMEAMPSDVILIIKNHPFVREPIFIPKEYADRVLDLTGKEHINDLMLLCDLLITDYSSCIFEAAILKLPMLFYAFDLSEYEETRDFYFDYEEMVPGPVEKNFGMLTRRARYILDQGDDSPADDRSAKQIETFREVFLSALDGHCTKKVYDYVRKLL